MLPMWPPIGVDGTSASASDGFQYLAVIDPDGAAATVACDVVIASPTGRTGKLEEPVAPFGIVYANLLFTAPLPVPVYAETVIRVLSGPAGTYDPPDDWLAEARPWDHGGGLVAVTAARRS